MTKARNNKNKKLFFFLGILVVLLFLFWFEVKNSPKYIALQTTQKTAPQKFSSKILKFEVEVPSGFKVEDKDTTINIINSMGQISIGRIGTNFSNVDEYLNDLGDKNKLEFRDKEIFRINNLPTIKVIVHSINNNPDELTYFIYGEYSVYHISTSSPELYEDLDKVARSFKYLP